MLMNLRNSPEFTAVEPGLRREPMLFYLVDWLPPDFGAVGQYATIAARDVARIGRHVRLIGLTSTEPASHSEVFENGGIFEVDHIRSKRYDKSKISERVLWTVYTNTRLMWRVICDSNSRGADIVFTGAP